MSFGHRLCVCGVRRSGSHPDALPQVEAPASPRRYSDSDSDACRESARKELDSCWIKMALLSLRCGGCGFLGGGGGGVGGGFVFVVGWGVGVGPWGGSVGVVGFGVGFLWGLGGLGGLGVGGGVCGVLFFRVGWGFCCGGFVGWFFWGWWGWGVWGGGFCSASMTHSHVHTFCFLRVPHPS